MAKEYKEGVDFEWVDAKDTKGNVIKDGKGRPVKTRRFFKKSEKEATKNKPAEKPAAKPRAPKKADKPATNAVRPAPGGPGKLPAAKKPAPGGARPEGPASGMPAKRDRRQKDDMAAGLPVLAAGAKVAATRKPAVGRPSNPNYTGRPAMAEGFQGRMNTDVARPRVAGGARVIGGNPARRVGGGRTLKMPDVLELKFMAKGGLVSKKAPKTYKK